MTIGTIADGGSEITRTLNVAVAADRATQVWNGYAKDYAGDTPPARVTYAAYYYAMQQLAANIISLKSGNIGALNGGKVAKIMLSKARGLEKIASSQIALFETWCESESGVFGANNVDTQVLLDDTMNTTAIGASFSSSDDITSGNNAADSFIKIIGVDFRTADMTGMATSFALAAGGGNTTPIATWKNYGAYGYAIRAMAGRLVNRAASYTDARNPEVGRYYQNAAQVLAGASKAITENFEALVRAQKVQWAIQKSGL